MQILILPLILGLFIFLFVLYAIGHDDFLLLRKNITLDSVFNGAFLCILTGLLFARIFYVVFNFAPGFLNPLVFFLFFYFPGLSLSGGLLGGLIYIFPFSRFHKLPVLKIFDLFSLSFLYAFALGDLLDLVLRLLTKKGVFMFEFMEVFLILLSAGFITKLFQKNRLGDSSIGFLCLSSFSFVYLLSHLAINVFQKTSSLPFLKSEGAIFLLIFIVSSAFLTRQEKLIGKLIIKIKNK